MVVSFKQNLRVINKTTNYYQHFEHGKKVFAKQNKGESLAIRKPMHKDTIFAQVNLRKYKDVNIASAVRNPKMIVDKSLKNKILQLQKKGLDTKKITQYFNEHQDLWQKIDFKKVKVYYFTNEGKDKCFATRKILNSSFDEKKIRANITDTGIQKILLAHLAKNKNADIAFSPEGIEELNRDIVYLNGGKDHQPIYKVRYYEQADKFAIGTKGNKSTKFVEAAKGTNLFFAIYQTDKSLRDYVTVSLDIAIACQKKAGKHWQKELDRHLKDTNMVATSSQLLFILSPNDLVYLPTAEQRTKGIDSIDKKRIYKFVSCSGIKADFIISSSASVIFSMTKKDQEKSFGQGAYCNIQDEFGVGSPKSKNERALTGEMIKELCLPLKVDRLGNIVEMDGKPLKIDPLGKIVG